MKLSKALFGLFALALTGCNDDPVSPTTSGSLSFTYTGAGATSATSYNATGSVPGTGLGSTAWAAGGVDTESNMSVVVAAIPRASSTYDMTTIGIARTTVGSATISPDCDLEEEGCTGLFVIFGQSSSTIGFTFECFLTEGSVAITSISSTAIAGTFSGTGICVTPAGIQSAFTVTSGAFNVPVTTQVLD